MAKGSCSVDGCERDSVCRGWCIKHYRRWATHGDPTKVAHPAPEGPCSVAGCDRDAKTRGWCRRHYVRFHRHGDPGPGKLERSQTVEQRIERYVEKIGNCWAWTGAEINGYGALSIDGVNRRAHRVIYEHLVGPIPEGLHLDHLCRNPSCVNPAHLEPVTPAENNRRARAANLEGIGCP